MFGVQWAISLIFVKTLFVILQHFSFSDTSTPPPFILLDIINMSTSIQGGPKITERHTSGNKDIRWLVSVDGVSSPEKNDTKISHFG